MIYTEDYVTYRQAKALECLGFDWDCPMSFVSPRSGVLPHSFLLDALKKNYKKYKPLGCRAPLQAMAAKFLRIEVGIDIVVQPQFNSTTSERRGYKWRWAQRTDVRDDKIYKTYEAAMRAALTTILNQITPK